MGNSKSKFVPGNGTTRDELCQAGDLKVAILGLDGAGKTTMLYQLALQSSKGHTSTTRK